MDMVDFLWILSFAQFSQIKYSAFDECVALQEILIPSSVVKIYDSVFRNCKSISKVHYTGSLTDWKLIELGKNNDYLYNASIQFDWKE